MPERIDPHGVVRLSAGYRLQWEPAQGAWVLLYPEGMVTLNASAGEIVRRCDGVRTVEDIIVALQADFPDAPITTDTLEFFDTARTEGWIHVR